jgi:hypothetical protein
VLELLKGLIGLSSPTSDEVKINPSKGGIFQDRNLDFGPVMRLMYWAK